MKPGFKSGKIFTQNFLCKNTDRAYLNRKLKMIIKNQYRKIKAQYA